MSQGAAACPGSKVELFAAIRRDSVPVRLIGPGGEGASVEELTLDEVFETVTLIQTGKIRNFPVILMGVDYWRPLRDLFEEMIENGTIDRADVDRLVFTDSVEDALDVVNRNATIAFGLKPRAPRKRLWALRET